jgi:predicted anti-sigma-YlaC factor YlaD
MECEQSVALLSDLNDGMLSEAEQALVRKHLNECPPCHCVFTELQVIVVTAKGLNGDGDLTVPDATIIWQRMSVTRVVN